MTLTDCSRAGTNHSHPLKKTGEANGMPLPTADYIVSTGADLVVIHNAMALFRPCGDKRGQQ